MAALVSLFILFLVVGELLCTSGPDAISTGSALHRAYSRDALLALQHRGDTPPEGLPEEVRGEPARATRRRRRGRRGGVRQRLRRRGDKPPLPSIILSNVRSLRSKMDELRLNCRSCFEYRGSSLLVFTESWLRQDTPDSLVELEGFSLIRADRGASSGKSRGGGICVYVSNNWCKQYTIRETYCDPDVELLCLSMRPFYLPREFGNIVMCVAYVPPSGNAARAANKIADCVHNQSLRTPGAPVLVLGDLNHCKLEPVLPGFNQFVKVRTRNDNILDKCYGNIKNAYRAKALPPLSNSDHATVHLMPTYKSALKSEKPQHKTVLQWTEDSEETLRGCFLSTDWSLFQNLDLNEATDTITDYINFCVDNIVPKKDVLHFPNNKPYITKHVKACINKKKLAFKNRDRGGMAAAQKELNQLLRTARGRQRAALEVSVGNMDSKRIWDCMKKITNMNSSRKQVVSANESERANDLNDFFSRFDSDPSLNAAAVGTNLDCIPSGNEAERLIIDPLQVQSIFRKVCNKKSTGPDGLPAVVLKKCSTELTDAWCPIFQKSLDSHTVPDLWKKSIIIPVPKVPCPTENKDFRPIALTCGVMKCFERVIVNLLKSEVADCLDPLQYAYREGRSTEDAVVCVTHLISKHLENPRAYVRVLFADFSSAFDTLQPLLLIRKLNDMNVNPFITNWFYSLLTKRSQQVKINSALSCPKYCSTGVPQGSVSSPFLFTAYTNDCRSSHPNNFVIKFSDDTAIISLLHGDECPSTYHEEISNFESWCEKNHLILNTKKTKEMIFDPRSVRDHDPVIIRDSEIEQVVSYKYLGIQIDNALKWNVHIDYLCAKLAQRLHFLRRLRLFGVSTSIMTTFYNAVLESLIRYGMAAWFGSLTVQLKSRIMRMVKTAMKVIGQKDYPSLQSIFENSVIKLANRVLTNPNHILHSEYEMLPSGRRFRASRCKSNRYGLSFLPTSIALLNRQRK